MRGGFFSKSLIIGGTEILCRLPLIFTLGLMARSIGPDAYGAWALLLLAQTLAATLGGLGLSASISRFSPSVDAPVARGHLLIALGVAACVFGLILLAAVLARVPVVEMLGITSRYELLVPAVILLAFGSVVDGVVGAYFKAREVIVQYIFYVLSRTLAEVVPVLVVFVTSRELDAETALLHYVGFVLLVKLLTYPVILNVRQSRTTRFPCPDSGRAFLFYGIAMIPTMGVAWLHGQIDRLVLSQTVSLGELGSYAFASTLASYLVFVGYVVLPLLLPRASRYFDSGELGRVRDIFHDAQNRLFVLLSVAILVISMFSVEILESLAGPAYIGASRILVILAVAVGLYHLIGIYEYLFYLGKRPWRLFMVNVLQALLCAAFVAIGARSGGVEWAAWGVYSAIVLANILRYRWAIRLIAMPFSKLMKYGLPVFAVLPIVIDVLLKDIDFVTRLLLVVGILIIVTYHLAFRRALLFGRT
jgi:O-antigen/teichoic acid export membrane protein